MGGSPIGYGSFQSNFSNQQPQSSGFTGTIVDPNRFPNTDFGHEQVQPINTNLTGIGNTNQIGQHPQLQLLGSPGGPTMGHLPIQDFPNMNYTGQGSLPPQLPMWNNQQAQQTQQGALTGMPLFQGFNNISSGSTFNGPQNPTTPFSNAVANVLGGY